MGVGPIGGSSILTYYAGNSKTFKAVVTTAHWAMEGYRSAMETLTVQLKASQ